MGKLAEQIFVCIDCETTGLDPNADAIIEVAVARFNFSEIYEKYETLIDPRCSIPPETIKIHNITEEMVRGKPIITDVIPEILSMIKNYPIVGHGVGFDIEILAIAADKAGISHTLRENKIVDTLRLARLYGESRTNSLEQLRNHFSIEDEGAHRAMSDVIVNVEVFKRLAGGFKYTKELYEILSKPIALKTMPLGKHKGRNMRDVPLEYLLWAANKDFDQDLLYSIRSEINRRKKGNTFSQASNPFSGL